MSFVIELASSPDRDEPVAEIWWNDQMIAEMRLSPDGNRFIDIYPSPSRRPWSFRFDEWMEATVEAERRIMQR